MLNIIGIGGVNAMMGADSMGAEAIRSFATTYCVNKLYIISFELYEGLGSHAGDATWTLIL